MLPTTTTCLCVLQKTKTRKWIIWPVSLFTSTRRRRAARSKKSTKVQRLTSPSSLPPSSLKTAAAVLDGGVAAVVASVGMAAVEATEAGLLIGGKEWPWTSAVR